MNDQQLIEALRRLDRPAAPSAQFADRLFDDMVGTRRRPLAGFAHRRRLAILAAVAALAGLVLAVAVGSELLRQRAVLTVETPRLSAAPSATAGPRDSVWVFRTSPSRTSIRVAYALPPGMDLLVDRKPQYLSFTVGRRPFGFGIPAPKPEGHGVRIIDASTVRPHYNNDLPLGEDAAGFMDGLQTHQFLGNVIGPISVTTLGDRPALMADLLPEADLVHMDTSGGLQVNFTPPGRLIVADVGPAIVLVEIWAHSEEALADWLDESAPLIDSLRIEALTEPAPS